MHLTSNMHLTTTLYSIVHNSVNYQLIEMYFNVQNILQLLTGVFTANVHYCRPVLACLSHMCLFTLCGFLY